MIEFRHANLYVSDVATAEKFYERVMGLELVRREPAINASFLTNGRSHHDIGLVQTTSGVISGRKGYVQPGSYRGEHAGLNHLGWDCGSEAAVIEKIRNIESGKIPGVSFEDVGFFANHQITHSFYYVDQDKIYHELYADIIPDWRTIFNLEQDDLVTEGWDWRGSGPGDRHYPQPVKERIGADDAPFKLDGIEFPILGVSDPELSARMLAPLLGFSVLASNSGLAVLGSAESAQIQLIAYRVDAEGSAGLKGMVFRASSPSDLPTQDRRFEVCNIDADCPAVTATDPDGNLVIALPAKPKLSMVQELVALARNGAHEAASA